MARTLDDHQTLAGARRVNPILALLRGQEIHASAILALSWGFAVLTASLLLWAGVSDPIVRAVMFVLAGGCAYGRLFMSRLGAVTSMDGQDGPAPRAAVKRWGDIGQMVLILLAFGFCAFGDKFVVLGPCLGAAAAMLLMGGALIGDRRTGVVARPKPDPGLVVAVIALIAAFEPIWHWRGEVVVIGLSLVCAALAFWAGRQILARS